MNLPFHEMLSIFIISMLAVPTGALMTDSARTRQFQQINEPYDPYYDSLWQPARPEQDIFVLHIPKAGGISLVADLSNIVGREHIWTNEVTYNLVLSPDSPYHQKDFKTVVTMLRDPRSHVLSQWQMCHTEQFQTDYPERPHMATSFEAWVDWWARHVYLPPPAPGDYSVLGCYSPVNLQTVRFSSWTAPSLQEANRNMMATDVVGLLEAYQESVCLFHAVYLEALPSYCNCANSALWSSFNATHDDHDNEHRKQISDYEPEVISNVDALTAQDRALYNAAKQRFLRDVSWAETHFGVKILCHDL
eukprot:CAMPEP_0180465950 /NCGR_PEP_ID=MMETSP1036_2-20121128/26219_1 /TAXON_ID=632150 /ORGANISM="Azadinium spinosum, Strain 3D9" /LENGTH=304 /DNA_ID=CAMNT_0022472839 /DNA_START=31 /DNA_END=945 /DNA_ORIENTATION=+